MQRRSPVTRRHVRLVLPSPAQGGGSDPEETRDLPVLAPARDDGESSSAERRALAVRARGTSATCPFCREPADKDPDAVSCVGCETRYHRECWDEMAGCATLGCLGSGRRHRQGRRTSPLPTPTTPGYVFATVPGELPTPAYRDGPDDLRRPREAARASAEAAVLGPTPAELFREQGVQRGFGAICALALLIAGHRVSGARPHLQRTIELVLMIGGLPLSFYALTFVWALATTPLAVAAWLERRALGDPGQRRPR